MINKISFKNYKSFKEEFDLELRPMTILIGKNSSGKSAVAKLPTLIENSLSGTFDEPIRLNNNGVELGAEFRDLVYGRGSISKLTLKISNQYESLDLILGSDVRTKDVSKILSWHLTNSFGDFTETDENNKFKGFKILSNKEKYEIKSLRLKTDYIGPFRVLPRREYSEINLNEKIDSVGIDGQSAYNLIIQDGLTTEQLLLKKINKWYQDNFEGWGIRVNQDKTPFYQIELTKDSGRLNINLKDIGQGMAQALPLVVSAFMETSEEKLIIIEEPESHLHPAAHGNLAELFVESLKDVNKRYLIETHSQNFVLRLRRLVAEKRMNKDDLIIYYVDFDENSNTSKLQKIDVDELGRVSYWPPNVFSETLDETIAIRTAQLNKKMEDVN